MSKPSANLAAPLLNASFSGALAQGTTTAALPAFSGLPVSLLGVALDVFTMSQALARLEDMIASGKPHYVATANVDFLIQARRDVELRRILMDAHMVLCDGTPLVWASRWMDNPLPERVAGADLVPRFIELAVKRNYRLYFLGGSSAANEQAVANLRARFPGINIVGHHSPVFKPLLEMDHAAIVREIKAAKPDVLLVSFGCPKAEKWMAMHYQSLGVPVSIGVGATIDFLAGHMRRAPKWMQQSGTEWLFRLMQEPRRLFMRYANDVAWFGWALAGQAWHTRAKTPPPRRFIEEWRVVTGSGWQRVIVPHQLDHASITRSWTHWEKLLAEQRHCLLDLSEVDYIDSTGIALLSRLHHRLRAGGHFLVILSARERLRNALRWAGLDEFFPITNDAMETRSLLEHARLGPSVTFNSEANRLTWSGEITAANANTVWEKSVEFLKLATDGLTVEISGVRFIDSSGAAVMLRLYKEGIQAGKSVEYMHPTPAVRNVLKLAKLTSLVTKP